MRVAGLAAALAVGLAALTWFLLEPLRDALLPYLMASPRPGVGELVGVASRLGWRWLLPVPVLAALAGLTALEWRRAALSKVLAEDRQAWPVLVVCGAAALWLGHSYLGHGVLLSGDTIAHVSMLTTRLDGLHAGQDPTWSNWKYLGLPLQAFYAPTTFWPLLQLARLADPTTALRCFLFAAHALSGWAAYALGRRLGLSRLAASVAAVAYAGAFAHLHLILYRGALPQALSAVLLPLALLFTHRVARPDPLPGWAGLAGRLADAAGLALAAGGLLANYTPLAIVAGVHMAVLALASLRRDDWPVRLAALAGAAAAAGALAACVLLPAALAGSEVLPVSLSHLLTLRRPDAAYAGQLLVWRAWRTDFPGGAAYLGLVPVLLALVAVVVLLIRRRPARIAATLVGLLALSTVLSGLHVRDVLLTVLYVALLAGSGFAHAVRRGWLGRHGPALLFALLLADLGSTAIQPVGRTDKGWLEAAGAYLAAQTRLHPSRTLPMDVRDDQIATTTGPSLLDWHPSEFVAGGHVEMATPAWVAAEEAGYLVEADLATHLPGARLTPETAQLLCLLRVGRVVGIGRTAMGLPAEVSDTVEPPLGRVLVPDCGYAVVFAPRLAAPAEPRFDPALDYAPRHGAAVLDAYRAHLRRLLAQMALAPDGSAERLLVADAPMADPAASAGPRPAVVHRYTVEQARVEVVLEAPGPGFVRLAHAWHPRLVAQRDGRPVKLWRDVTGCVVVAVAAGANTIGLAPGPSPGLQLGQAVSAATLALLALALAAALFLRIRVGRASL